MKFFFDRCMSIKLCRMVAILETGRHHLAHHNEDSRFTEFTQDTEWIEAVSRDAERPIVLSGDCKILKRPDEVAALQQSSLTFFCLADHWTDFPIYDQAWKFLKVWPEILKAAVVSEPTVFQVCGGKSLKVERYALTKNVKR